MKQLSLNKTFKFGEQLADLTQEEISACPAIGHGIAPEDLWKAGLPEAVLERLEHFPWTGTRKYQWIYIRPQFCDPTLSDTRSGNFYHLDVDAIYKVVTPYWGEFIEHAISFGDIAEVSFISEPMVIEAPDTPSSDAYVTLSSNFQRSFSTTSPANAQFVSYTGLDAHKAGPIRKKGWRLFLIGFETDALPKETWP